MPSLFDPSRSPHAYSTAQYQRFVSQYTGGRVAHYTAVADYRVVAQRALVAAQRWQQIPFREAEVLPLLSLPLPYYSHYIPGLEYSASERAAFAVHYGSNNLDDAHVTLESQFPLDPSFVALAQWLRSEAPTPVLNKLYELYDVTSSKDLFALYYVPHLSEYHRDLNVSHLLRFPLDYCSDSQTMATAPTSPIAAPIVSTLTSLRPSLRSELITRVRATQGLDASDYSLLELYLQLEEPLPPVLATYLLSLTKRTVTYEASSVGRALTNSAPATPTRFAFLHVFTTKTLLAYCDRQGISAINPLSASQERYDVLTALTFLPQASDLDFAHLDAASDTELSRLASQYGLEATSGDRNELLNSLYLSLYLPTFYYEASCSGYAYGINSALGTFPYQCYTLSQLETTLRGSTIPFTTIALRHLEWLLRFDVIAPSLLPLLSTLRTRDAPLLLLQQMPETTVAITNTEQAPRTTTYSELVLDTLDAFHDLGLDVGTEQEETALNLFYDRLQVIPALLRTEVLALPMRGEDQTIGSYYNMLVDQEPLNVKAASTVLRASADYYLSVLEA